MVVYIPILTPENTAIQVSSIVQGDSTCTRNETNDTFCSQAHGKFLQNQFVVLQITLKSSQVRSSKYLKLLSMKLFSTIQGNTITGLRIALQQFAVLLKYRTVYLFSLSNPNCFQYTLASLRLKVTILRHLSLESRVIGEK